jgi:hypothetical protein
MILNFLFQTPKKGLKKRFKIVTGIINYINPIMERLNIEKGNIVLDIWFRNNEKN